MYAPPLPCHLLGLKNPSRQLEKYRVMRNVALAAMGHPSLTAIPTETAAEQRQQLKRLKAKALKHVRPEPTSLFLPIMFYINTVCTLTRPLLLYNSLLPDLYFYLSSLAP